MDTKRLRHLIDQLVSLSETIVEETDHYLNDGWEESKPDLIKAYGERVNIYSKLHDEFGIDYSHQSECDKATAEDLENEEG